MYTFFVILHLIVCLFLIFIILIQSSKGAEMGAAFGGSSQTLFGSRGAATFMSKLTSAAAILFMITSLTLAIVSVKRESVMNSVPAQESAESPVTTAPGAEQATAAEGGSQKAPAATTQSAPAPQKPGTTEAK
jgi:preprotein translocase subunit SecG